MIKGRKVVLREKRLSDAVDDYAWRCDPELARLDAAPPSWLSFSEFMMSYAEELRYPSPRRSRFGIDTLDGKHIGNCMYYDIDHKKREAEIGIMIGNRNYWDQGYGTDAITTLVRHIFEEAGLERVYLNTLNWNFRAQRCFEKCGFVPYRHLSRGGDDFVVMELRRIWPTSSPPSAPQGAQD
jgi:ribosomal-protein-alanine N-acetyltransferase